MGPVMQYVDETPDAPLTINVYTGADGRYSLYEDDGSRTATPPASSAAFPWPTTTSAAPLTIGPREGSYPGMAQPQLQGPLPEGGDKTVDFEAPALSVTYAGEQLVVSARMAKP